MKQSKSILFEIKCTNCGRVLRKFVPDGLIEEILSESDSYDLKNGIYYSNREFCGRCIIDRHKDLGWAIEYDEVLKKICREEDIDYYD